MSSTQNLTCHCQFQQYCYLMESWMEEIRVASLSAGLTRTLPVKANRFDSTVRSTPLCAGLHLQAEAQCAWLDAAGLVDGVVTDDNDVFLFGGRHVYRCVNGSEVHQTLNSASGH